MYFWGDLPKAVTKIQIIFKNGEVYELPRSAIYGLVAHRKLKNSDVFEYIDIEINAEYKNFKPITEIDNKGLFERIESCWDINCIDVFFNGGLDQKIFCSWLYPNAKENICQQTGTRPTKETTEFVRICRSSRNERCVEEPWMVGM